MTESPASGNPSSTAYQEQGAFQQYFLSAGFERNLVDLQDAIDHEIPLLILTGGEGLGKTTFCRFIAEDGGQSFQPIYFPKTVDSFEDALRSLATEIGIELTERDLGRDVEPLILEVIEHLRKTPLPILLIFDQAENIFLATLERIRRLLDRIYGEGSRLHLLFVGRPVLLDNLEQLSICEFRVVQDLRLNLLALSDEESLLYLDFCQEQLALDGQDFLSDEIKKSIVSAGNGNFKTLTLLIKEALATSGEGTSFMVLLEKVADESGEDISSHPGSSVLERLKQYKPYLPWVGGLVSILFLLLIYVTGDRKGGEEPAPEPEHLLLDATSESVLEETRARVIVPGSKAIVEDISPTTMDEGHGREKEEAKEQDHEEKAIAGLANQPLTSPVVTADTSEVQEPALAQPAQEVEETSLASEKTELPPRLPEKDSTVITVVELQPDPRLKRAPQGKQPSPTLIPNEVNKQKQVEGTVSTKSATIYRNRVFAGNRWANGSKNHLYTVQLMVLTASAAEENIKKMLSQDRYRQEAGNFYIFERRGNPDQILVFYGEYRSMARARLAKDSLPQFLRDHKPYAISIKNALKKMGM